MASRGAVLLCLSLSVLLFDCEALSSLTSECGQLQCEELKQCALGCTDNVAAHDYRGLQTCVMDCSQYEPPKRHVIDCRRWESDPLEDYNGDITKTESGRDCQPWAAKTPHNHRFTAEDFWHRKSLEESGNYCRNPDSTPSGPWCYTMDPNKRWETCNIKLCPDRILTDTMVELGYLAGGR